MSAEVFQQPDWATDVFDRSAIRAQPSTQTFDAPGALGRRFAQMETTVCRLADQHVAGLPTGGPIKERQQYPQEHAVLDAHE